MDETVTEQDLNDLLEIFGSKETAVSTFDHFKICVLLRHYIHQTYYIDSLYSEIPEYQNVVITVT